MADFQKIVAFTKSAEGGLSRAKSDTASAHASPCEYNGQTGWHTNKGITWDTFRSNASSAGYDPSCNNFTSMPDSIWIPIAKKKYWDLLHLDEYTSQAVANLMFSWEWGSGNGWEPRIQRYLAAKGINWNVNDFSGLKDIMNSLTAKNEAQLVNELFEQKKQFLLSLKQPANEAGWLSRLEKLRTMSMSQVAQKAVTVIKQHWLAIGLGFIVFTGSILLIVTSSNKK